MAEVAEAENCVVLGISGSLDEELRKHPVSAPEAKVPKQDTLKLQELTDPSGQRDSKSLV